MNRPLIVSLQRPQNDRVLTQLIEKAGYDIAVRPELISASLRESAARAGTQILPLRVGSAEPNVKAQARTERIGEWLPSVIERYPGIRAFGAEAVVQTVLKPMEERLTASMELIDALDDLLDSHTKIAVLVNETDLHTSRTAVLWAKHHHAPSYLISSRANLGEPTTVTRKMLADYVFVFGERAAAPYRDMGVPAERIAVTGNPAWDHYDEVLKRRGHYRSEVFANLKLKGGVPLVIFATTGNAKLSALAGAALYEQTVRVFLQACKQLVAQGVLLNAVIKDLPSHARRGRAVVARIAAEESFDGYTFADGDLPVYLCAADVMVSYDASVFVEAMMAAVPAVNIWCPQSWLLGPAMDRRDGVPLVRYDDPWALADSLRTLLTQPAAKQQMIAEQKNRFGFFHVAPDGRSAARCADEILRTLEGHYGRKELS